MKHNLLILWWSRDLQTRWLWSTGAPPSHPPLLLIILNLGPLVGLLLVYSPFKMSNSKKSCESPVKNPPAKRKQQETGDTASASIQETLASTLAAQQERLEAMMTRILDNAVEKLNHSITNMQKDLDALVVDVRGLMQLNLALLEDYNRRNNVRITGIPNNAEGGNVVAFLQESLPKWLPSLANMTIEIERAHRVRSAKPRGDFPETMILRLFRHADRTAILNGARPAERNGPIQHAGNTLRFYADYSAQTSQRRKAFSGIQKKLHARLVTPPHAPSPPSSIEQSNCTRCKGLPESFCGAWQRAKAVAEYAPLVTKESM
uniref:Uncharacterized protein n=1 Tax=Oryzias latipes TaxID=8090 RepID=A0A3B3HR26_ORYLA